MIDFNENDLIKLFESQSKMIDLQPAGIYNFIRLDKYGFTLDFYFSIYEQSCCLSLLSSKIKTSIFGLSFKQIESIKCINKKLIIKQTNNLKNIVIYFEPNYSLKFEKE